jgi:hypothetical protein
VPDLGIQHCAAGEEEFEAPAELLVERSEEMAAQAERESSGYLMKQLPHLLLAGFPHFALDTLQEEVEYLGHGQDGSGVLVFDRLEDAGRLQGLKVDDARAMAENRHAANLLEEVAQR